eukprot:177807-Lingulodinium_polyedra.AAC.1
MPGFRHGHGAPFEAQPRIRRAISGVRFGFGEAPRQPPRNGRARRATARGAFRRRSVGRRAVSGPRRRG